MEDKKILIDLEVTNQKGDSLTVYNKTQTKIDKIMGESVFRNFIKEQLGEQDSLKYAVTVKDGDMAKISFSELSFDAAENVIVQVKELLELTD